LKTKYEWLCERFAEADKQHDDQRKACFIFAKAVLSGFQEFLGCPTKAFSLRKAKSELSENEYTSREAEVMEEAPDGYWKFQFDFHVQFPKNALAGGELTFEFLVRQTDNAFTLRWGTNQYNLTSNLKGCEEFPALCDTFFDCARSILTDPISWHPSDARTKGKTGPIGYSFAPSELPEKSQQ